MFAGIELFSVCHDPLGGSCYHVGEALVLEAGVRVRFGLVGLFILEGGRSGSIPLWEGVCSSPQVPGAHLPNHDDAQEEGQLHRGGGECGAQEEISKVVS